MFHPHSLFLMGQRVLSPAIKVAHQAAKAERKHTAKAAQNKLIQDRKAYSDEIFWLALQYAPPQPQLQQHIGEKHNWTVPIICLGMGNTFEIIGRWFHKHIIKSAFPFNKTKTALPLTF